MTTPAEGRMAAVLASFIETLAEVGDETPEGLLYAGSMHIITLQGFQTVAGALVRGGWAERRPGPCLQITEKGRAFAAELRRHRERAGAMGGSDG